MHSNHVTQNVTFPNTGTKHTQSYLLKHGIFLQFVYISPSQILLKFQQSLPYTRRFQVIDINLLYSYISFLNSDPIIMDLNNNNHHLHITVYYITMHNINLHQKKA